MNRDNAVRYVSQLSFAVGGFFGMATIEVRSMLFTFVGAIVLSIALLFAAQWAASRKP